MVIPRPAYDRDFAPVVTEERDESSSSLLLSSLLSSESDESLESDESSSRSRYVLFKVTFFLTPPLAFIFYLVY